MAEQVGNNAVKLASEGGSKEALMARIAEAESKGLVGLFNAPQAPDGPSVAVETRAPVDIAPVQAPAPQTPKPKEEELKPASVQKYKDSDGKLDLAKVEKSNEHLMRGIESREEKLLKLNRELQKKFHHVGQELAAKSSEMPEADPIEFTDEGKKRIIADMGLDPNDVTSQKLLDSIVKISRTVARRETEPFAKDVRHITEVTQETRSLKELDDLVKEGNEWIITEGTSRFDKVLEERPYLRQSRTPYRDALRFMELQRLDNQPTQARVGAQTPILGASQTVPPPSTLPPSTPEQDIESLSLSLRSAMTEKNFQKAKEIEAQMDRVYRGMYRR
ncbi:MAG: hypothetical protein IPJ55_16850 [Chloracidobacterium sp.]|nr:hypothetical protein [Chloracidobacterium sp.]